MKIYLSTNIADFSHLLRICFLGFALIASQFIGTVVNGADFNLRVKLHFDYKDTDLRLKLYDVKSEFNFSVARTSLASSIKEIPVTEPIKSELAFSRENKAKTFVLVVENKSDHTRYFFATPHTFHPGNVSMGVIFECFCNHHVYKLPAKMIWYRIVRLEADFTKIAKKNQDLVLLSHSLIEISEAKAVKDYRQLLYDPPEKKE